MIPVVAAQLHGDLMPDSLDHDHVLHRGTALERLIHGALQFHHLAVVIAAIHGDDQLGLAVLDAPLEGIHRETTKDYRVDGSDLGAGEHGKGDLGDASHVDRDPVALADPHRLDDIGHAGDLTVHGEVRVALVQLAVLALPDQGDLVFAIGFQVPVNGIVDDISFGPREPLEKGFVGVIQNPVPLLEPLQLLRLGRPEALQIRGGFLRQRLPVLQARLVHDLRNGIIDLPFHFSDPAVIRHGNTSSVGCSVVLLIMGTILIRF